jgi:hypothetical protein
MGQPKKNETSICKFIIYQRSRLNVQPSYSALIFVLCRHDPNFTCRTVFYVVLKDLVVAQPNNKTAQVPALHTH